MNFVTNGLYVKYLKRLLDFLCSLIAIIAFSWLYIALTILGIIFMRGNPFFFQKRPGKNGKIFNLIKFRSMDNRKDKNGQLLPDEIRLNKYGKFLRATSLDEIPEVFNILKGDMSIIGPRPQLVKDMVFMTEEQKQRHIVRPGLSGLAQVNGRNAIAWEEKFVWDLRYIENITFLEDLKIILKTIEKVFKRVDINREGTVSDMDLGDYLLHNGKITREEYDKKLQEAGELLKRG